MMAHSSVLPKLILASQSPRRRELLAEAGYPFEVIPPAESIENEPPPSKDSAELVAWLAYRKAADVRRRGATGRSDATFIVAADTVVECDGRILGKPADEPHAHRVLTGLCVWPAAVEEPQVCVAVTRLRMDRLSDAQLDEYMASGQWSGKAGAFGYQDRLGWIHVIEGSPSNVVGLPLELLAEMIRAQ
jgi:septum formation protein